MYVLEKQFCEGEYLIEFASVFINNFMCLLFCFHSNYCCLIYQ